jgi:hypothetical protein
VTAEPDATRSGTTLPVATLPVATLSDATLSDATLCHDTHCITCGDDGIPMTVLAVDAQRGLALCTDADERHHTVETALVEPVAPGQTLLVHAGTAITGGAA